MSATSYATEHQSILTRLQTNWTRDEPIAWPNTGFDPGGAAHLEVAVAHQPAFNADIAPNPNRRVRHPGLLSGTVRVPLHEGDGLALAIADAFAVIYRNVTFDGITFRAPTVGTPRRDGAWYMVEVIAPFHRDSLH